MKRAVKIKPHPTLPLACDTFGHIFLIKEDGTYERISLSSRQKGVYVQFRIVHKGETRSLLAHRVLAETMIPNPNNYPIVNHKNGNKSDNSIENLEWCTQKTNAVHAKSLVNNLEHRNRDGSSIVILRMENSLKNRIKEAVLKLKNEGYRISITRFMNASAEMALDQLDVVSRKEPKKKK